MARRGLFEKEMLDLLNDSDFEADSAEEMCQDEITDNVIPDPCCDDQSDIIEIDVPLQRVKKEERLDLETSDFDDIDDDGVLIPSEACAIATAGDTSEVNISNNVLIENIHFTPKSNIQWRRKEFHPAVIPFNDPPTNESEVLTPLTYFLNYIPNEIFDKYAFHTNQYVQQNNVNAFKPTNAAEIKKLFALHILVGCMKFPRLRLYWSPFLNFEIFCNSMSNKRFCQLRQNLHVVNNLERPNKCTDKFFKTRPLIDAVRARCLSLRCEEKVSIDEQIIPFKGRLSIKQYVKGKPNPWGIKVFVLCGKSGIPYDFFLYQGSTTGLPSTNLNRFGFGASVVLRLVERLQTSGHKLFFDNFFSTYNLFEILHNKGINAAGTVRINRFANPPIMNDKQILKKHRGFCDSVTSRDGKITLVKWRDNKPINLASNFVGIGNTDTAKRWEKNEGKYISVERPEIVRLYNSNMGGVDLLDQLISYYRVFIHSKKWTLRVTTHFLDFAVCASWLEYKRDCEQNKIPKKKIKDLLEFRLELAYCLAMASNSANQKKRGRPSSSARDDCVSLRSTSKPTSEKRPYMDIRFDEIGHLPSHDQKSAPTRCKNLNCDGRTFFICKKCKVHLCISKSRNCFEEFHTKH